MSASNWSINIIHSVNLTRSTRVPNMVWSIELLSQLEGHFWYTGEIAPGYCCFHFKTGWQPILLNTIMQYISTDLMLFFACQANQYMAIPTSMGSQHPCTCLVCWVVWSDCTRLLASYMILHRQLERQLQVLTKNLANLQTIVALLSLFQEKLQENNLSWNILQEQ